MEVKNTMTEALAKYSLPGTYDRACVQLRDGLADTCQAVARGRIVIDALSSGR